MLRRPKRSKNEVVAPKEGEKKKKHVFLMKITSYRKYNAYNNISNPG
jgi:hypothetical protein